MKYYVKTTSKFDSRLKRLVKKYPSLAIEYQKLVNSLESDPVRGISIGKGCYKLRLSIASKGKGKSGGARVIYYIHVSKTTILLLTIFDKSEQESIPMTELVDLLSMIDLE
jgi:mRNA-degrading endonuclease RelE of RelBE toxin-antitoxin system